MREEIKYNIKVRFLPGSEAQEKLMDTYLEIMLKAVEAHFGNSHKRNRVYTNAKKNEDNIYWIDDGGEGYTL